MEPPGTCATPLWSHTAEEPDAGSLIRPTSMFVPGPASGRGEGGSEVGAAPTVDVGAAPLPVLNGELALRGEHLTAEVAGFEPARGGNPQPA